MFKKGTVGILILILLMMGLFQFAKTFYVSKSIVNEDLFDKYDKIATETSVEFEPLKNNPKEKYLVICDGKEENSELLQNNLKAVLKYMKKDTDILDVTDKKPDLNKYSGIVIAFENLDKCAYIEEIITHCKNGGGLIFAEKPITSASSKYSMVNRSIGIIENGASKRVSTIQFNTNLLLKANGLKINLGEFDVIPVQLDNECIIHCKSPDNDPIIWERGLGKGKIVFINGQFASDRIFRGILCGAISMSKDSYIYPVVNTKVAFIDDFPLPVTKEYNQYIWKQYGTTVSQYYRNYWWPDMMEISKKHNIKYSTYVIETYEDRVKGEFDSVRTTDNVNNAIVYGKEILANKGEIGIHGYDHQPLVFKGFIKQNLGYKSWENEKDMRESIKELKLFMNQVLPNYEMRSYVPPSNILSPDGRIALANEVQQLKVISGLYNAVETDECKQEFGVGKDGIVDFPRVSSGYLMSNDNKLNIYNAITMHGIFSHFVHPDDALDSERNGGKTWEKMKKEYEKIVGDLNKNFSWLRSNTITEAGVEVKRYSSYDVEFKHTENAINGYCKGFKEQAYFILRSKKNIGSCTNCEVSKIDDGTYLVKANKCDFTIGLDGNK